jgi:hypothetical protein
MSFEQEKRIFAIMEEVLNREYLKIQTEIAQQISSEFPHLTILIKGRNDIKLMRSGPLRTAVDKVNPKIHQIIYGVELLEIREPK